MGMGDTQDRTSIEPLPGFDAQHWIERWDRMQERYLVRRAERFATMVYLVKESSDGRGTPVTRVLNLGCGPGSVMEPFLDAFPQTEVYGVDFNPTILLLARERLAHFGARAQLFRADLRQSSWMEGIPTPVDAVISATALHWLLPDQLTALYYELAGILRPGSILLNADHVGSEYPPLQQAWERHRTAMRAQEGHADADDWDGFWKHYAQALSLEAHERPQRSIDGWEGGVEDGLPLTWHLDRLRECGFQWVDCFWRCDCDAIYGGITQREGNP